jgi:hypothetical protein
MPAPASTGCCPEPPVFGAAALHAKPGTLPEGTLLAVAREAVDEDRAELIDLVEIIRDCQERSDLAGLEVARKQLSDLLFYLET